MNIPFDFLSVSFLCLIMSIMRGIIEIRASIPTSVTCITQAPIDPQPEDGKTINERVRGVDIPQKTKYL